MLVIGQSSGWPHADRMLPFFRCWARISRRTKAQKSASTSCPPNFALAAAIYWYDRGLISQDKGAAIARVGRVPVLSRLSDAKVNPLQVTPEELKAELDKWTFDARR